MGFMMKYRFLQTIREWSSMFWAFAFPLILGTLFQMSFGSADMTGEDMETIPAALVVVDGSSTDAKAFIQFLENIDVDTIKLKEMNETKAMKELKGDKVSGIFYADTKPSLSVAKSGINESILKSLMDTYGKNAALVKSIARTHPERMEAALVSLGEWRTTTEEVSLGGRTLDPNIQYFFALIAYACMSGTFLGVKSSFDSQANLSALGARRSITPTHKLKFVLVDMLVIFCIHFVNTMILTLYVRFVLGVDLGDNWAGIILVNILGSMIGVSVGIMLGCLGRFSENTKMGLAVLFSLLPGFLAGLMIVQVKDMIEHTVPLVNRLNPVAVISDAFYCMAVYNDTERFIKSLTVLGVMSVLCILAAFLRIRRERYDSI